MPVPLEEAGQPGPIAPEAEVEDMFQEEVGLEVKEVGNMEGLSLSVEISHLGFCVNKIVKKKKKKDRICFFVMFNKVTIKDWCHFPPQTLGTSL